MTAATNRHCSLVYTGIHRKATTEHVEKNLEKEMWTGALSCKKMKTAA